MSTIRRCSAGVLTRLFRPTCVTFPVPKAPRLVTPSGINPCCTGSTPETMAMRRLRMLIRRFKRTTHHFRVTNKSKIRVRYTRTRKLLNKFLAPLCGGEASRCNKSVGKHLELALRMVTGVHRLYNSSFVVSIHVSKSRCDRNNLALGSVVCMSGRLRGANISFVRISKKGAVGENDSVPTPNASPTPRTRTDRRVEGRIGVPMSAITEVGRP